MVGPNFSKKADVKLPFLASRQCVSCQSNISGSLSCRCVPGRYLGRDWANVAEKEERDSILTPLFHHTILHVPRGVAERELTQGRDNRAQWPPHPSAASHQQQHPKPSWPPTLGVLTFLKKTTHTHRRNPPMPMQHLKFHTRWCTNHQCPWGPSGFCAFP